MNLLDTLTKEDNKLIEDYISRFGIPLKEYCGNQVFLRYWAKNKENLYHLLGDSLRIKLPFPKEKNEELINISIIEEIASDSFICIVLENYFSNYLMDNGLINEEEANKLLTVISDESFINNAIPETIRIKSKDKKLLQLQKGTKVFSALQKILKYFNNINYYKKLEKLRVRYAQLLSDKALDSTICISIHPLDFMTLSDNGLGWHSCLSWQNDGSFKNGTIEMMNSKYVVCCYLEDRTQWNFDSKKPEARWNNKRIRQLFYITDSILLSGKPYPYANTYFTTTVLKKLRELAEKNLNLKYESTDIEEYEDMNYVETELSINYLIKNGEKINIRNIVNPKKLNRDNTILFETNCMYNDFLNELSNRRSNHKRTTHFYCYRNKVKGTKVYNCSGETVCLICGKENYIYNDEDNDLYFCDESYNNRYARTDKLICSSCEEKRESCYCCDCQDKILIPIEEQGVSICEECLKQETKICADCGKTYIRDLRNTQGFLESEQKVYLITTEEERYYEDFQVSRGVVPIDLCEECKQKYIDLDEIKYYVPRIKYNHHYYSSENLLVSTKIGKDSLLYKNCIKD